MVPGKNNAKWEKLIQGEVQHSFKSVPAGLMLSRLRREAAASPDGETLQRCVDEMYVFFIKYETVLHDDIAFIFGKEA